MPSVDISASILAADLARLGAHMEEANAAGAERFHVDVMDGRFVPNITFGPPLVEAARRSTKRIVEAHLMILEPERYIPDFAAAGADIILVHQENCAHLHSAIQHVHQAGKKAGVVLNPATPVSTLEEILPDLQQVLIMTVNPGFGGQRFLGSMVPKIAQLRQMIVKRGLDCDIEVDGGIGPHNAAQVVKAGANVLVAGTSVFRAPEGVAEAVRRLHAAAQGG